MIKIIKNENMGRSNLGWLKSLFHFSFAEYYNTKNMNFGVLRVLNDDLIEGGNGFELHPHRDMEIISYVVEGELTHKDSMGNHGTLQRGHVQYMSAGTGVLHSEHNLGTVIGRILQVWILPDQKGYTPNYGESKFSWESRVNQWFHMVSGRNGNAPIKVNQDVNFYSLELEQGKELDFKVGENRQAYYIQIEGNAVVNGEKIEERDGAEIIEETLYIQALTKAHILVIEMKKQ